ncbi:glutaredoxin [Wolbachia endosymbiont of Folsomia candida]|uniref:glutaredoxin n=1 Tax=Wolbachia endosymbiont of Folsomia candida TaxID=169402 RepID=UPI000A926E07|nr:glutaredoxin [Wolbachia endosymbiont of Folsomia candida]APR98226.1 glutaredoxin [Wolbachia endosymbiont of Folsomia candida]
MKNVVIYVKKGCPYCIRAKDLLDKKGVKYEEIDVLKNSDSFNVIKSTYNVRTVPQIFIADENGNYIDHIAGSDKLMDLEREGKLDDMLSDSYNKLGLTTNPHNDMEYHECGEYPISDDDLM